MPVEPLRRREYRDRTILDVEVGKHRYQVWIVPTRDMNKKTFGHRIWISPVFPIMGDEQRAEAVALRALERMLPADDRSAPGDDADLGLDV